MTKMWIFDAATRLLRPVPIHTAPGEILEPIMRIRWG